MASLMRGGANAGPCRNDELCPKGTPRRDEVALAPPKARTSSPWRKRELLHSHYFHAQLKITEIKYKIVEQKKQH